MFSQRPVRRRFSVRSIMKASRQGDRTLATSGQCLPDASGRDSRGFGPLWNRPDAGWQRPVAATRASDQWGTCIFRTLTPFPFLSHGESSYNRSQPRTFDLLCHAYQPKLRRAHAHASRHRHPTPAPPYAPRRRTLLEPCNRSATLHASSRCSPSVPAPCSHAASASPSHASTALAAAELRSRNTTPEVP